VSADAAGFMVTRPASRVGAHKGDIAGAMAGRHVAVFWLAAGMALLAFRIIVDGAACNFRRIQGASCKRAKTAFT
jgi:hypothetical protein